VRGLQELDAVDGHAQALHVLAQTRMRGDERAFQQVCVALGRFVLHLEVDHVEGVQAAQEPAAAHRPAEGEGREDALARRKQAHPGVHFAEASDLEHQGFFRGFHDLLGAPSNRFAASPAIGEAAPGYFIIEPRRVQPEESLRRPKGSALWKP